MDLKEITAKLDVVKTWFSPGSARHHMIADLADAVAEHAGGREELPPGDPNLATPGPGVKSPTAVTEVDSVGQIADAPQGLPSPDPAASLAGARANKDGDKPPV